MTTTPTEDHTSHLLALTAALKHANLHAAALNELHGHHRDAPDPQDATLHAHVLRAQEAIVAAAAATAAYAIALQDILASQETDREDRQPPHHPSQGIRLTTTTPATD